MNKGKALLGVLAGIAAGAALGVLFAPDKGSNTRKKIINDGKDLADAINDKIDEKFDEFAAQIIGKSKFRKSQESPGSDTNT